MKFSLLFFAYLYTTIDFNLLFLLPMLGRDIMAKLNLENLNYKYIILYKNMKLPDEICNNIDDTYIKNIKKPKEMISYKDGNLTYR